MCNENLKKIVVSPMSDEARKALRKLLQKLEPNFKKADKLARNASLEAWKTQ